MVKMTEGAGVALGEYFKDKEITPIRITLTQSCGGGSFGLFLDDQKDTDDLFLQGAYTFVVDKNLIKLADSITVDFVSNDRGNGFSITSENPVASSGGCGSCSCG